MQHLAGGVVDDPPHARCARRLSRLLDNLLADEERRVGDLFRRDRAGDDERTRIAHDAAVSGCPVERDRQRRRADPGAQQQPVAGVVDELQVDVGIVDRRVAPLRVVTDVERVIRPGENRQPGLIGRVEHRGRDLADAAAEPGLELAVDDHGSFLETLRGRPRAGCLVEREHCAGRDHVTVDEM